MCLVFKTTCIDAEKPLREGAFSFVRRTLFSPLYKRNTHDKAKGLRVASERYIGKLVVRYLSTLNRAQDSRQQYPHRMRRREGGNSFPSLTPTLFLSDRMAELSAFRRRAYGRLGRGFLLIFDF